jgi:hypothetical protein
MSITYYGRDGIALPADWMTWRIQNRVARTDVNGVDVSTVWLGTDHNFRHDGPPVIFETMLFDYPDQSDRDDNPMRRYTTEEGAMRGHLEAVDALRAGEKLEWF